MRLSILMLAVLLLPAAAMALDDADRLAISAAALDYGEGWYQGDSARMERALHPDLVKRMIYTDPTTKGSQLHHMDAPTLIELTSKGGGSSVPGAVGTSQVEILDVFENAAVVKVSGPEWVDYLHLAQWNGQWLIINVLWEFAPEHRQKFQTRNRSHDEESDK